MSRKLNATRPLGILWVCCLGLLSAGFASAQLPAQQPELCESEQAYLKQTASNADVPTPAEDFGCFVHVEEADQNHPLVVDVRKPSAYAAVNIPGSINIRPDQLLYSDHLKDTPLLVVDQGFQRTPLAQLCHRAKAQGFTQLKILMGGLAAWQSAKRPLTGDAMALDKIHQVSSEDFLQAVYRNNLTLLADKEFVPALKKILPEVVVLRELTHESTLDSQIVHAMQDLSNAELFPVVLFTKASDALQTANRYRSTFVLADTLPHLQHYYQDQLAIAKKREQIPDRYRCGRR